MSTLENTVSMMKNLPETDLIKIQTFIKKLSGHHEFEAADEAVGRFLRPMSREEFMKDIEKAEREITDRKYRNAEEVFDGLEHRYGL